jgi:hypothetical protein
MEKILQQLERAFPEALIDIRFSQASQMWKVLYSDDHKFSISKQPTSLEYVLTIEELQDVDSLITRIKQDEENNEK